MGKREGSSEVVDPAPCLAMKCRKCEKQKRTNGERLNLHLRQVPVYFEQAFIVHPQHCVAGLIRFFVQTPKPRKCGDVGIFLFFFLKNFLRCLLEHVADLWMVGPQILGHLRGRLVLMLVICVALQTIKQKKTSFHYLWRA